MPALRCTFCLSKARAETAPGPREALHEELLALRPSKLEWRARSLGIDELALDAAKDSESVVAMVELVIAATPVQPSVDALREELASLRPSALERRARSLGVSEADLDEAKDSDTMSAKEGGKEGGTREAPERKAPAGLFASEWAVRAAPEPLLRS